MFKLPVVLVLILCVISIATGYLNFGWRITQQSNFLIAIFIFVCGLLVIAISGWQFRNASTTVNPVTPEKTSALVTYGLYAYSRNPMYIGFLLWLTAAVVYSNQIFNVFLLPLFVVLANRLYIMPEEKALTEIFGRDYQQYSLKVRRWF